MTSIAATLGIGSGLDSAQLVKDLAAASKAPKEKLIANRESVNTAKVSKLAAVVSGIDGFASALSSLIAGGTLFTQPTSADSSIVSVSAIAGARLGNLAANLEVKRLASAQTLVSDYAANGTDPIGQGSFTLTTAAGAKTITIDAANDSLAGFARAINASNAGVTASVITDTNGARLSIKGATGAAQGFSLTQAGGDPALAAFTYDPATYDPQAPTGLTRAQAAQDALLVLDGVEVTRATNSFSDLIPGVAVTLNKASVGTTVAIGSQRPTTAIGQAVNDFVAAFNELKTVLDEATARKNDDGTGGGPLRGDPGIKEMQRQLAKLTTQALGSGSGVKTLAEIGVYTNRDGSLGVNATQLDKALASDPDGVEALFNPTQTSSSPLVSILNGVGKAKPGTYALTDLVAGPPASGKIGGVDAISSGSDLIAAANSPAVGLVVKVLGDVAAATVTVDAGLGGILKSLRDALRTGNGALIQTDSAIKTETKAVAAERLKLEARSSAYEAQLSKAFTAMDGRVAAFKATQSYLDQQIKIWTNGN